MKNNRPKLKLKLSKADKILELGGWLALTYLWGTAIANFNSLPQIIPTHYDGLGKVNNYGNRGFIFMLPIIGTIIFTVMTLLNKSPHIFSYSSIITTDNAKPQYTNATRVLRYIKLLVLVMFCFIVYKTVQTATGKAAGLGIWFLPFTGLLLFLPGIFFLVQSTKKKRDASAVNKVL